MFLPLPSVVLLLKGQFKMAKSSHTLANLSRKQRLFLDALVADGIDWSPVARKRLLKVSEAEGMTFPPAWIAQDPSRRADRGFYSIPEIVELTKSKEAKPVGASPVAQTKITPVMGSQSVAAVLLAATGGERSDLVPTRLDEYVPFGNFKDLECIIKAAMPKTNVWITGLSGNGKTMMVEQVCAKLKRECVRVQITNLTDEDDLIGGFRLIDGNTVWQDGPIVLALKRGAVLLLDEIDYGTPKLSCLQSILEGNGVFIKQTNVKVVAAKGFLCIATANTKGQGDDSGKFIGTNGMNEAFLERFGVTLEQSYAPVGVEKKIIEKKMETLGIEVNAQFAANLVQWADTTRKTFEASGSDSLISTRRLVNVVELFGIFGDKEKAIRLAIARFDRETKESFWNLWTKIDVDAVPTPDPIPAQATQEAANSNCPF